MPSDNGFRRDEEESLFVALGRERSTLIWGGLSYALQRPGSQPEWEFRHRGERLARLRRIQAAQAVQPDVNTAATGAALLSALTMLLALDRTPRLP